MRTEVQSDDFQNARELGKSKNRKHLLDSAANVIFKSGFRSATIAEIQKESGLSRGMINLHFKTKENLMLAVAQDLAQHYSNHWERVKNDLALSPAEKLIGIIQTDLSEEVLNPRHVAVWFAFRSEVVSHPAYAEYIDSRDKGFRDSVMENCIALIEDGKYSNADATLATNSLTAMLEGMWTDFHLHSDHFNREKALESCLYVLRSFFPKHY